MRYVVGPGGGGKRAASSATAFEYARQLAGAVVEAQRYIVAGAHASAWSDAAVLAEWAADSMRYEVIAGSSEGRILERDGSPDPMSVGLLASFWYYRKFDLGAITRACPLILDSGAFTAHTQGGKIDLYEYAEWLDAAPRPYDFAFTLDVLGDERQSFRNWERMRDRGTLTVPVVHFGQRPEAMTRYIDAGATRLALGGLAGGGPTPQAKAWTAVMFRALRDQPDVLTHGLGIHLSSPMARFPWTTTDSSTFGFAWRFARLMLWDGRRWHNVHLNGKDIYRHAALVRSYGFEPEQVAVSTPDSREDLVRFVMRVECRAAADYDAATRAQAGRYMVNTTFDPGDVLAAAEEASRG